VIEKELLETAPLTLTEYLAVRDYFILATVGQNSRVKTIISLQTFFKIFKELNIYG